MVGPVVRQGVGTSFRFRCFCVGRVHLQQKGELIRQIRIELCKPEVPDEVGIQAMLPKISCHCIITVQPTLHLIDINCLN